MMFMSGRTSEVFNGPLPTNVLPDEVTAGRLIWCGSMGKIVPSGLWVKSPQSGPHQTYLQNKREDKMNKLLTIQTELNAPKTQLNKFGGYHYRSCEDILSAVKPLLKAHSCTLWLDDEMVLIGNRIYVKATATFIDGDIKTISHGWAREEETKKGMDSSQITGAASSYARKYALNALFLIDDTKDSDSTNDHGKDEPRSHSEPAKPAQELTATGMVKDKGKANAGGYIPFTLDNQQMDDGKDIKFTTKTQNFIDILDNALENGNKVHITYSKTEYRGYCAIHSVIPVLKE